MNKNNPKLESRSFFLIKSIRYLHFILIGSLGMLFLGGILAFFLRNQIKTSKVHEFWQDLMTTAWFIYNLSFLVFFAVSTLALIVITLLLFAKIHALKKYLRKHGEQGLAQFHSFQLLIGGYNTPSIYRYELEFKDSHIFVFDGWKGRDPWESFKADDKIEIIFDPQNISKAIFKK